MSGYLSPSIDTTPNDAALAITFQNLVAGVTGLPPTLIFPRWQPVPPTMPVPGTDWGAIGSRHTRDTTIRSGRRIP